MARSLSATGCWVEDEKNWEDEVEVHDVCESWHSCLSGVGNGGGGVLSKGTCGAERATNSKQLRRSAHLVQAVWLPPI